MKQITTYSTLLIFLTIAAGAHAGKSNIDYSSKSQIQSTQKPVTPKLASPKIAAPKAVTSAPPRNTQKRIIPGTTNAYGARSLDDGETWKMQNQPSSTKTRTLQNRSTNQYQKNTIKPQSVYTAPRKAPPGYNPNSAITNNKALQNRNMNQYRNNALNQPPVNRNAMQRPQGNTGDRTIPGASNGLTKQYGRPQNAPVTPSYGFGSNKNTYTPGGSNTNSRTSGFGNRDLYGTRPGAPDMKNPMGSPDSGSTGGVDVVEHNDSMSVPVPAGSANLPVMGRTTQNTTPGGIPVVEHTAKDGVATPAGTPTLPIMTSPTGQVIGNTSNPPVMGASTGPMGNTNTGLTAEATAGGGKKYSNGRVVDAQGGLISGPPVSSDGNKVFDGRGNMAVAGEGFTNIVSKDGKSITTVDSDGNVRAVFAPTDSTSDTPRGKKDGPDSTSPSSDGGNSGDSGDDGNSGGSDSGSADSSDTSDDDNDGDSDTSSDDSSDDSGSDDTTADSEETGGDEGSEGGDEGTEGGDTESSQGTGDGNETANALLQKLADNQDQQERDEDNSGSIGCGKTGQMGPGGGDCTSKDSSGSGFIRKGNSTIDSSMIDVRPTGTSFGPGTVGPGDCFKPEGCDESTGGTPSEFLGDSPFVNPVGD